MRLWKAAGSFIQTKGNYGKRSEKRKLLIIYESAFVLNVVFHQPLA